MFGTKWINYGTWTATAATATGQIETKLKVVEAVLLSYTGNGVSANAASVDETLPLYTTDNGLVDIDFDAASTGTWIAIGRLN
jgi:hypothetical protein